MRRGATFLRGGARGAPEGYIKPEPGDERPPQRTAPREVSLPSHGDRDRSRRAAGVATRPGRQGRGGDRRTGPTAAARRTPGRVRPTHCISPSPRPVSRASGPRVTCASKKRQEAGSFGKISKFIPSPLGAALLDTSCVPRQMKGFAVVLPRVVPSQQNQRTVEGTVSPGSPSVPRAFRL